MLIIGLQVNGTLLTISFIIEEKWARPSVTTTALGSWVVRLWYCVSVQTLLREEKTTRRSVTERKLEITFYFNFT